MTMLGFLISYVIISFLIPILEALTEYIITIIKVKISVLSLKVMKLQQENEGLQSDDTVNTHVIGFSIDEDEIEEDDE